MKTFLIFTIVFTTVSSCTEVKSGFEPSSEEVVAFKIEFGSSFDPGSPERRLEKEKTYFVPVTIKAVDDRGDKVTNYEGMVELELQYGKVFSATRMKIENGISSPVLIEMSHILNRERVVVHEIVPDKERSKESFVFYKRSGKIGVSDTIYAPEATIYEIQSNNTGYGSFNSRYNGRNLDVEGKMVVLAVVEGGFYLKDVNSKEYGAIYLYTYSAPYVDDPTVGYTLPPGTIIEYFNGSVFEFFGFTEITFPTYRPRYNEQGRVVVDKTLIPQPVDITMILDDDREMEKWESSLVTVKSVTVDYFFELDRGFTDYGQFPLKTEEGRYIVAQTLYTAPHFNPVKERDRKNKRKMNITGVLKQHTSARPSTWILVPRDSGDIDVIE